jgi:Pyruvate/2-oxoacid:ferredoxin oxidoreductase gamma subunit
MKNNQNISNIIANEIYRKYQLQLKQNIVVGEIESLLKKHPNLKNNISFTLGLLTLNDARAVLSILLNEIKQLNKGWKKTYKKEYWYFIQNLNSDNKQSNFKSVVFLFFIFLLVQHDKKLNKIEKIKELRFKKIIESNISDFIIKKNKALLIEKIKSSMKNKL